MKNLKKSLIIAVLMFCSLFAQAQTELDKLKPFFVAKSDLTNDNLLLSKCFYQTNDKKDFCIVSQNDTLFFIDIKNIKYSIFEEKPLTKKIAPDLYQVNDKYFMAFDRYSIFIFDAYLRPVDENNPSGIGCMFGVKVYHGGATKTQLWGGDYKNFPAKSLGEEWLASFALGTSSKNDEKEKENLKRIFAKNKMALTNAINNKAKEEKQEKQQKEIDAVAIVWNAEVAKNPDAALTFEENFAKWSAKGKPKLVYFNGHLGFLKGTGTHAIKAAEKAKYSDWAANPTEYKNLDLPQTLEIVADKARKCNYVKFSVDNVAGQNTGFQHSGGELTSLYGYKKSLFYGANPCRDVEKNCTSTQSPLEMSIQREAMFWIKGNLVSIVRKSRDRVGYVTVYSYPGATKMDWNSKTIDDLWLYFEKLIAPKQATLRN